MKVSPNRRLKVGVATSGRFHLLDLARELDRLGVEVSFYSYVPKKRAASFGLRGHCHVALLPLLFPIVAVERLLPELLPGFIERLMCWSVDLATTLRMRKCDVFVCMSGIFVLAPIYAKWRYRALIHLHRSSQHILSQKMILANLPGAKKITRFMQRRELRGYTLADRIIVPSIHVMESFRPWPEDAKKVFLNPLGVDIEEFPLRERVPSAVRTVLFVGQWSYRKGVDVLVKAIGLMDMVRLVHVGVLVDAPFPVDARFEHNDHVAQDKLTDFYAAADLVVLPSREDGFGVVIMQALASGCQVVCTDRTGGPDLCKFPGLSRMIQVVQAGNVEELYRAMMEKLGAREKITESERQSLSWKHHAARDLHFMQEALKVCQREEASR
jgi:alpha-maltose-1-phosphate synthase